MTATDQVQIKGTAAKGDFAGDVIKLASGATFAQALAIITTPILTRLFVPEVYGVSTLFLSVAGIIAVVACLRYEVAIMLPEHTDGAANVLAISLAFAFLLSLIMIPAVWFGREPIARSLRVPALAPYLCLIPLVVFINGAQSALNNWISRTKRFGVLSVARVAGTLTTTPLTLGLGLVNCVSAGSLIGSGIVGQTVSTSILAGQTWRRDGRVFLKYIRWHSMKESMWRYRKFPMLDLWSGVMNVMSVQLPPLLLAGFFSSTAVGHYALAHRLLSVPMGLIGSAIGQVFFQRAAEAKNVGSLPTVVRSAFSRLMALGVYPLVLVMFVGRDMFSVVLGAQWEEAGVYAQILAPWLFFVFLGSPISTLFNVLEIQESHLIFNSILLATRVAAVIAGGLAGSILHALMLFSSTGAIMWAALCVYLTKRSGVLMHLLISDVVKIMMLAGFAILPVFVVTGYGTRPINRVIVACFSALVYYSILCYYDESLRYRITRCVKKPLDRAKGVLYPEK